MPQKSKARAGPREAKSKSSGERETQKSQRERFIEAARAHGVDESGREFDRALAQIVKVKKDST